MKQEKQYTKHEVIMFMLKAYNKAQKQVLALWDGDISDLNVAEWTEDTINTYNK